jgi:hypothetical protein
MVIEPAFSCQDGETLRAETWLELLSQVNFLYA